MFLDRKTVFLGKKFPWQGYPMPQKDVKKWVNRAVPEFALAWKLKKDTQLVVLGVDPDAGQLAEAEQRGLATMPFSEWVGETLVPGATSAGELLRGLVAEGFAFDVSSNEADGTTEVHTVPVGPDDQHPWKNRQHLNGGLPSALPTLVRWVQEHHGARFAALNRSYGAGHRDMRGFYDEIGPGLWMKTTASIGTGDHGPVIARSPTRVLPPQTLDLRLGQLSSGLWARFCLRFADGPVEGPLNDLFLVGALDKDQTLSFAAIQAVHT